MTQIPTARERIARIIDPVAWTRRDKFLAQQARYLNTDHEYAASEGRAAESVVAPSLAKADMILSDRAGEGGGAAFDADRPEALAWGLSMLAQMMTERPLTETERVDAANNLLGPASRKLQRLTPSPTGFTEEEVERAAAAFWGKQSWSMTRWVFLSEVERQMARSAMRAALATLAPHPSREGEG